MRKELAKYASLAIDMLFFSMIAGIGFTGGVLMMLFLPGLIYG